MRWDSSYPERLMLVDTLAQTLLQHRGGCTKLSQEASHKFPSLGLEASCSMGWGGGQIALGRLKPGVDTAPGLLGSSLAVFGP